MQVCEFRCLDKILVNKVNFSQLSKMRGFFDSFIPFAAFGVLVVLASSRFDFFDCELRGRGCVAAVD